MIFKAMWEGLTDFWKEFRQQKSGLIGLGILGVFILLALLRPIVTPFPDIDGKWRDLSYWEDSSPSAKPVWTNWLTAKKAAVGKVITDYAEEESVVDGFNIRTFTFEYNYKYAVPPSDLIIKAKGYDTASVEVIIERPDGKIMTLPSVQEQGMAGTIIRYPVEAKARVSAYSWSKQYESEDNLFSVDSKAVKAMNVIFAQAESGILKNPAPLKGTYKIHVKAYTSIAAVNAQVSEPSLVVVGKVSGIMGTDSGKRDVWTGLVAGIHWALIIGFITSFFTVIIGVFYGIISAYFGGVVDTIMSFIFEIFIGIPILPVLIVINATRTPSVYNIIAALIIFSWVGPVKTVRSMALQIKEETYIEAAKAIGASKWRIIFKHMAPLLLPYSFASMALAVPGAIIYEATLSLIGVGDASIISWGQILQGAVNGGAVLNGLWWWVVPPGLAIAILGMSFAFLGFSLDKILHPKLRTR